MTRRTQDKMAPGGAPPVKVHTVEQIGNTRHRLPNGNLLCMEVPIARTGWLLYGPGEVPVKPGTNGVVYIERTRDELFNEKTMGSFQTAAVTDDHPVDDVTPVNWNQLSVGFALNVRQATQDGADILVADLMITNKKAIEAIEKGKIEVSIGYDADYEDMGGGIGRQTNILGNHIALVDKGRCGPRCAIGDSAFQPPQLSKDKHMSTRTPARQRVKLLDEDKQRIRRRVLDAEAELDAARQEEEALDDDEQPSGQNIHINLGGATKDAAFQELEQRVGKLETGIDKILEAVTAKTGDKATKKGDDDGDSDDDMSRSEKGGGDMDDDDKPGKGKKAKDKTGDSAALEASYRELMAQAEILQPGFKTPTFDAALTRASTVDRMCNVRRKVLDAFGGSPEGAAILLAANGGKPVDLLSMDCAATAVLFGNAATAKAAVNNATATRDSATMPQGAAATPTPFGSTIPSLADINKANAEFYKGM